MRSNFDFESDQWWIDYMEGECESGLHDGLQLLLHRSAHEQKKLASYEGLRALIKDADDVYVPESGLYYAEQRRRVMRAILESERESAKGLTINVEVPPLMLVSK